MVCYEHTSDRMSCCGQHLHPECVRTVRLSATVNSSRLTISIVVGMSAGAAAATRAGRVSTLLMPELPKGALIKEMTILGGLVATTYCSGLPAASFNGSSELGPPSRWKRVHFETPSACDSKMSLGYVAWSHRPSLATTPFAAPNKKINSLDLRLYIPVPASGKICATLSRDVSIQDAKT